MTNLNGTWLGTYWQAGIPTSFEITLIQSGNTLSGRVLDDSYLGEAQLTGEIIARRVSFTNRYFTTSLDSINYTGTLSEDENSMHAQWNIAQWDSRAWEARRSGKALMVDLQTRVAKQVSLTGG